jgi:hypothetical protein
MCKFSSHRCLIRRKKKLKADKEFEFDGSFNNRFTQMKYHIMSHTATIPLRIQSLALGVLMFTHGDQPYESSLYLTESALLCMF